LVCRTGCTTCARTSLSARFATTHEPACLAPQLLLLLLRAGA
jgi:hypothetical protein